MSGISGIVPILLTPFQSNGEIDFDSLNREIDFALETGVHGIGIAIGSEIHKLLAKERRSMLAAVVARVAGRVPVVMNTSADGTAEAVERAKEAADLGADRLMIWPPSFFPLGPAPIVAHYAAISKAVDLPIILQDVPQAPISAAQAIVIAEAAPTVDAIKVETPPIVGQVGAMTAALNGRLSVLGGAGGGTLIEEIRRSAQGTMPFASQSADFMALWRHLEKDDIEAADHVMETRILPVARVAFQSGDLFYHVHKSILHRQGVFARCDVRPPTSAIEAITQSEVTALLDRLWPA